VAANALIILVTTLVSVLMAGCLSRVLGAILSLSSTAVVLALDRAQRNARPTAGNARILVVQDLLINAGGVTGSNQPTELIGIWCHAPCGLIHRRLLQLGFDYPIFLRLLARTESRELFY